MLNSILPLLPPILVLLLIFFTQNVVLSLLCGVFSSALIVTKFAPLLAIKTAALRIASVLELQNLSSWQGFLHSEKLFLFMFLLLLGMIIALLVRSGESYGYVERLCRSLRTRVQAQLACLLLSASLFIDDYLNSLTTSTVMRNLTDRFKIPRLKLAFLTTAMAAPLCAIVPISSWSAAIIMFLTEAGINKQLGISLVFADGFTCFLKMMPFMFFPLLLILSTFFIVLSGASYGELYQHEHDSFAAAPTEEPKNCTQQNHSNFYFFSPLVLLSSSIFAIMLISGGFLSNGHHFLASLQQSLPDLSLFSGALLGFGYTALLFLIAGKIKFGDVVQSCKEGFLLMKDSLIVLTLAWTLASFMKNDLGSGKILATFLMPLISNSMLPLSIFLMSSFIAFAIGSSWATMAVMLPMSVPMVLTFAGLQGITTTLGQIPMLCPTLGAIISGAIWGSSLSPIADLLVITSKNTQVNLISYLKVQAQYLFPVGLGSATSFALAGIFGSRLAYGKLWLACFVPGICVTFGLIVLFSWLQKRQTSR